MLEQYPFDDPPIVSTNRRFAPHFERWIEESKPEVELVIEETVCEGEKLGTVGALAFLVDRFDIDEDLLVVGGDNIFDFSLGDFVEAFRGTPLVALYDVRDVAVVRGRYGVAVVEGDRIVNFQEKPQDPMSTLASTACYMYPRRTLALFAEFTDRSEEGKDAPGYFNAWLMREKDCSFSAFSFSTPWYDIGDRTSYIEANQHYCGCDSFRAENSMIRRSKVSASVILEDSTIEDCEIAGCVIGPRSRLSGVALSDCIVGPGTAIRGD